MADWLHEFVKVDAKQLSYNWCGLGRKAFFCAFCNQDFKLGDEFRMIFTNDLKGAGGNPLCCKPCFDKAGGFETMREEWKQRNLDYRTNYRWFTVRR